MKLIKLDISGIKAASYRWDSCPVLSSCHEDCSSSRRREGESIHAVLSYADSSMLQLQRPGCAQWLPVPCCAVLATI